MQAGRLHHKSQYSRIARGTQTTRSAGFLNFRYEISNLKSNGKSPRRRSQRPNQAGRFFRDNWNNQRHRTLRQPPQSCYGRMFRRFALCRLKAYCRRQICDKRFAPYDPRNAAFRQESSSVALCAARREDAGWNDYSMTKLCEISFVF